MFTELKMKTVNAKGFGVVFKIWFPYGIILNTQTIFITRLKAANRKSHGRPYSPFINYKCRSVQATMVELILQRCQE